MNRWIVRSWFALALLVPCVAARAARPADTTAALPATDPRLDALADSARAGVYGEVHQLYILRRGEPVLAQSFNGWKPDSVHAVWSVTKSVTALLVGIAIDQGQIPSLETPLSDLLPEYSTILRADPRKAQITLENLLTMQAGFEWDERAAPYGDPHNPTTQMAKSDDWVRFVLERPMATAPGTRFVYNSGVSVLLGAVLERATSTRVADLAARNLFEPLGIPAPRWDMASRGLVNTGWGLWLRPADLAKIGLLVAKSGRWGDRTLVSKSWIDRMVAQQVEVRGRRRYGYGYQWWRMPAGRERDSGAASFAWGFGDQFLFVLPQYETVLVVTGGNYDDSERPHRDGRDLVQDQLVPALRPERP